MMAINSGERGVANQSPFSLVFGRAYNPPADYSNAESEPRDKEKWLGAAVNATLNITLNRVLPPTEGDTESIEIVKVEGAIQNKPVTLQDVELQLCTLEGDEFWVDSGRFEVTWPINL